jgi:hypothetical protein
MDYNAPVAVPVFSADGACLAIGMSHVGHG